MGRNQEIKLITTECVSCNEIIFPKKIDLGDSVYQCPKCGCFLELEEEKTVIFDSELDLDPPNH